MTDAPDAGGQPAANGWTPGSCGTRGMTVRRAFQITARTVHIASMGLVLGAVALGAAAPAYALALRVAVVSGLVLLPLEMHGLDYFTQGNGLAVVLKLALLAVAWWILPDVRLGWLLAATVVASFGSHMPGQWRHWSPFGPRGPW
jgi:hypothetical protein